MTRPEARVVEPRRAADEVDERRLQAQRDAWDASDWHQHVTFPKPLFSLVLPVKGISFDAQSYLEVWD